MRWEGNSVKLGLNTSHYQQNSNEYHQWFFHLNWLQSGILHYLVHSALDFWKNGWNTHNWLFSFTNLWKYFPVSKLSTWPTYFDISHALVKIQSTCLLLQLCFILSSIILSSSPNLQLLKKCPCFSSLKSSSSEIKNNFDPSINRKVLMQTFWVSLFSGHFIFRECSVHILGSHWRLCTYIYARTQLKVHEL